MANRSTFAGLLLAATSFAGGLALGLLLAPRSGKENRQWINNHASELSDWVIKQREGVLGRGENHFKDIRSRVHRGLKNNVPDLYEATEHLNFDENDFLNA